MRLMVFFDLPTKTDLDKKAYTMFRRQLLKNGFSMIQFSVYSRLCCNPENADKYLNKISKFIPKQGHIRAMTITDKQYHNTKIMLGTLTVSEKCDKNMINGQISLF